MLEHEISMMVVEVNKKVGRMVQAKQRGKATSQTFILGLGNHKKSSILYFQKRAW